jgi:hypothetical protein
MEDTGGRIDDELHLVGPAPRFQFGFELGPKMVRPQGSFLRPHILGGQIRTLHAHREFQNELSARSDANELLFPSRLEGEYSHEESLPREAARRILFHTLVLDHFLWTNGREKLRPARADGPGIAGRDASIPRKTRRESNLIQVVRLSAEEWRLRWSGDCCTRTAALPGCSVIRFRAHGREALEPDL